MRKKAYRMGLIYAGLACAGICLGASLAGSRAAYGAIDSYSAEDEYDAINQSLGKTSGNSLRSQRYGSSSSKAEPDWDEEQYVDDSSGSGPGQKRLVEEGEEKTTGPQVKEAALSETYHDEYEIYEENLEDAYFIYSTVENGGITDKSVALDIPAGLSYVMEKDGVEIPYTSGQAVSQRGTYVIRFTAVDDKTLPFSEQTLYKAVFRFRIQEKAVKEEETESGSTIPDSAQGLKDTVDALEEETLETKSFEEELLLTEPTEEETGEDGSYISEDGTYNEDAIDAMIEEAIGTGATDEANVKNFNPNQGLGQVYDDTTGLYTQTLLTGSSFRSNVPNGMVTNDEVRLSAVSEDIVFRVFKNGTEVEYEPGTPFIEAGSYQVMPEESTTLFISGYNGKTKPIFQFRIVNGPVNDLGTFPAPEGMEIISVTMDGREMEGSITEDGRYARFFEDGRYQVTLFGEQGQAETTVDIDRVQPKFYVLSEKNRAVIQWVSGDTARCVLYKDGKEEAAEGIVYEIEGSGKYELVAYDSAGNSSRASFEVKFALNKGAVIAIMIAAAIAAGGVFFVINVNKKLKVR